MIFFAPGRYARCIKGVSEKGDYETPAVGGKEAFWGLINTTKGITKTYLFKYIENFTTKKWKFSDKIF